MKKEGLTQQAYKAIKELILSSRLVPGQVVTESEMQQSLGFGRTPIREAFLELSRDQLVVIHPRKGIEICSFSPKKVRDIFKARVLLEPPILYEYMDQLDQEWLLSMKKAFAPFTVNAREEDQRKEIVAQANVDDEFHRIIVGLMGNSYLNRLMDSFFDYLTMIRIAVSHNTDRYNESNLEHVALIDAILAGDREDARDKLKIHIDNSLKATMENFMYSQY